MPRLSQTYFNERVELFPGAYDSVEAAELSALSHLYNPYLGPVTSLIVYRPEIDDFSMYSASSHHSGVASLMRNVLLKSPGLETLVVPGGGKGVTAGQSALGALGEIAERLLASLHIGSGHDAVIYGQYDDLIRQGLAVLGPGQLPLFAAEQYAQPGFEYVPFTPVSPLGWVRGTALLSGASIWVPAQLVLVYYQPRPDESRIGYSTSGGLAFHSNRLAGILHGLYEVIERDAINVRWYSRLAPPAVKIDLREFFSRELGQSGGRLATPFLDTIRVFLNTLDVQIPVFTVITMDRSRKQRALLAGGGAWSGRVKALRQALLEVGQVRTALKFDRALRRKVINEHSDVSEMTDFFDATLFYGHSANLERLAWYMRGETEVPWDAVPDARYETIAAEYEAVKTWLLRLGFDPIVFDFSSACGSGMSVTKVLITELTQACVPSHPYLGHSRFYELPRRMGLTERRIGFGDLNRDPLPLP